MRDSDVKSDYLRGMEREHRTTGIRSSSNSWERTHRRGPRRGSRAGVADVRCVGILARWFGTLSKRRQDDGEPQSRPIGTALPRDYFRGLIFSSTHLVKGSSKPM